MILDLDIGNSRLKWRLIDGAGNPISGGVQESLPALFEDIGDADKSWERVRVCCVRKADWLEELDAWLASRRLPKSERVVVEAKLNGVVNGYECPEQLGVDRWMAICAAYRRVEGSCLVVDAGSALTLDLISDEGVHLGGYILPGLHLTLGALAAGTDQVFFSSAKMPVNLSPGVNTQDAVVHGVFLMLSAFVSNVFQWHAGLAKGRPHLLLSGGDAEALSAFIREKHQVVPDLVFQGIEIALP